MAVATDKTLSKHIRASLEQWEHIERASQDMVLNANKLVVELTSRPSTDADGLGARRNQGGQSLAVLRPSPHARPHRQQTRVYEDQEIREFISGIVPDPHTGG